VASKTKLNKILIANRGEIACRVIKTLHAMGKTAIAVYSDIDENALHVEMADQAIRIGAAEPESSYLSIGNIIEAARDCGADAIHPGYGFLSENYGFAQACDDAGFVFIGPPADIIQKMGLKDQAKLIAEQAGVPILKTISVSDQNDDDLADIGFPILVKAIAGGGGKGMKRVDHPDQLTKAIEAARRESMAAFGDDQIMLEKYITDARHIEVQILADGHGNCVHLFERDCSLQRRYQKVIEESPAPGISDDLRTALGRAAVSLSKSVKYVGAGTVEFLVDGEDFYFMEMNTRLQVEHPVTEMITGLDLVEWQLRIAAGETLSLAQADVAVQGHAIEARLYAENPGKNFMPATGTLDTLKWPEADDRIRIDTGVREGDDVTIYYDPLLAKIIGWGEDRGGAVEQISRALAATRIGGLENNLAFLTAIMNHADFCDAKVNTGFIGAHFDHLNNPLNALPEPVFILAALFLKEVVALNSPWENLTRWQMNLPPADIFSLKLAGLERHFFIRAGYENDQIDIRSPLGSTTVKSVQRNGESIQASTSFGDIQGSVRQDGPIIAIEFAGQVYEFIQVDPNEVENVQSDFSGSLTAPLPGKVIRVELAVGDRVREGQDIVILESMKMECSIAAPTDGMIEKLFVGVDDTVEEGDELVIIAALNESD